MIIAITLLVSAVQAGCGSSKNHVHLARHAEDLDMRPADFHNITTMTKVRGFFIDNRLGHLADALRVANSPTGGVYPVGTIIQLVPTEAMVKRRPGWNPSTRDWEFFSLSVSATGTLIAVRGTTSVLNQFGGNCFSCHELAQPKWDLVCEHTHGCTPLPISDTIIAVVQQHDPRPG